MSKYMACLKLFFQVKFWYLDAIFLKDDNIYHFSTSIYAEELEESHIFKCRNMFVMLITVTWPELISKGNLIMFHIEPLEKAWIHIHPLQID